MKLFQINRVTSNFNNFKHFGKKRVVSESVVKFSESSCQFPKMYFTHEERRILCFLKIDERLSYRKVADRFHAMFPGRPKPSGIGVKKMLDKLRATGTVADRHKSGRPRTATDEANEVLVLGSVELNMRQSIREVAMETGSSLTAAWRILKRHKFHPYGVRLVQELSQLDYAKREDFCEIIEKRMRDPSFVRKICFSDESTFHRNGVVNRHNCRYWATENPNVKMESHSQKKEKVNVWAGVLGDSLIGPFLWKKI